MTTPLPYEFSPNVTVMDRLANDGLDHHPDCQHYEWGPCTCGAQRATDRP